MSLTDSWLKHTHNKEGDRTYVKSDREVGLGARVSPKGKIVFQYRYRYDGKPKRLDLGVYPALSLKDARKQVVDYKKALQHHKDPALIQKLEKLEIVRRRALEEVYLQWHEKYQDGKVVQSRPYKLLFYKHVINHFRDIPASDITAEMWHARLDDVAHDAPGSLPIVLSQAKRMLSWLQRKGEIEKNHLQEVTIRDYGVIKKPRDRHLSDEELKLVFEALCFSRMHPAMKNILKLNLLFACRCGEILSARVEDFDLVDLLWTVPPENHKTGPKTGKPIVRPIPAGAVPLIEAVTTSSLNGYLNPYKKEEKVRHQTAMYRRYPRSLNDQILKARGREMEQWQIHDLRRTARSYFSRFTEPHIAEIMLGHKLPGVWGVYDKHSYIDEQREAYTRWYDYLKGLLGDFF